VQPRPPLLLWNAHDKTAKNSSDMSLWGC
jgi:hypothetical protein